MCADGLNQSRHMKFIFPYSLLVKSDVASNYCADVMVQRQSDSKHGFALFRMRAATIFYP